MDRTASKPNHLTECGRVYCYFNKEKLNFFIINCILCNGEYSDWRKFSAHFRNAHQLEKNFQIEQIDIQLNDKTHKLNHQFEDYFNTEYLEEDFSCNSEKIAVTEKSVENSLMSKNSTNVAENSNKETHATVSSCFFRLYTTDSNTMLKFIELLRQHPSLWKRKSDYFAIKEKVLNSTLSLAKQLKDILNINVTPDGTRASILALLRWFDREYIRYVSCQQNDFQFVSIHKEYFDKLLEFLPHNHLKPMTCDKCPKHFKTEHLLMAHKHKYHNGQVPFRCRYCGHGFIHQSSHKLHENRHTKIHVWPCKICRYQATSKSDYIKHLSTHSSQQRHKCNVCGLTYKTKSNLNVHLKSHSLPNYECEICKKKFYEKYRYKRHIWQHEKQEMSCKSVDNFTCQICGRRFTSNKTLMKHQLVHVQENYNIDNNSIKNYKLADVLVFFCGYCSLEFIYKEAYETHMKLKHNEKYLETSKNKHM